MKCINDICIPDFGISNEQILSIDFSKATYKIITIVYYLGNLGLAILFIYILKLLIKTFFLWKNASDFEPQLHLSYRYFSICFILITLM